MARCGRCGLWNKYPEDFREKKYAGVCVWYQLKLPEHEVYELRNCEDFEDKIPEVSALEHFEYKIQRDQLGNAYKVAKRSQIIAWASIIISVITFLVNMIKG